MREYLRWDEWLTKPHKELEALGFDPSERFHRIGHKRALSSRWALTIGMWGLKTPTEIMGAVGGMNPGDSSRGTFDVFKHRHRLYSGPQFARYMANLPLADTRETYPEWTQAELANSVYIRVKALIEKTGTPLSGNIIEAVRLYYHLLPIEVYLYYRAISDILAEKRMTQWAWWELDYTERREIWNNILGPGEPMVVECPDEVRYAIREKQGDEDIHRDVRSET